MRKALLLFFLASMIGYAKGEPLKRFEVGFVVGGFDYGEAISANDIRLEYGGRFVVNLHQHIALEYQMVFSGRDSIVDSSTMGIGHIKGNIWKSKNQLLTIFGIAGPCYIREQLKYYSGGFQHTDKYRSVGIDYGGGVEIAPKERFALRLDLTDFYAGIKYFEIAPRFWHHHLDFKAALMFRF
jgi:hypothetical protein